MVSTFIKKRSPAVLPETLPDGTLTTVNDPYILHGEARLVLESEGGRVHERYRGDWRCNTRKPSSFVAASLVDWDRWRTISDPLGDLIAIETASATLPDHVNGAPAALAELSRLRDGTGPRQ